MCRLAVTVVQVIFFMSIPALAGVAVPIRGRGTDVGDLIPLVSWKKQFEIIAGKDRGRIVPLTFERHSESAGRWKLSFGDYAGIVIRKDGDRGLVMERLDLFKSGSYIVYEPALPLLAANIAQKATGPHQASFEVFDGRTGRSKRTGLVSHQVKRILPSRFDTPAGPVDGYYIVIDHRMDMKYADLEMTLGIGFRLNEGPIFGSGQYTLTKLGIFRENDTWTAALTAPSRAGFAFH